MVYIFWWLAPTLLLHVSVIIMMPMHNPCQSVVVRVFSHSCINRMGRMWLGVYTILLVLGGLALVCLFVGSFALFESIDEIGTGSLQGYV